MPSVQHPRDDHDVCGAPHGHQRRHSLPRDQRRRRHVARRRRCHLGPGVPDLHAVVPALRVVGAGAVQGPQHQRDPGRHAGGAQQDPAFRPLLAAPGDGSPSEDHPTGPAGQR